MGKYLTLWLSGLFFVVSTLVAGSVLADVDVDCKDGGCLSSGWDSYNDRTGEEGEVSCNETGEEVDGCKTAGWTFGANKRVLSEIVCRSEGCFNKGWTEYDFLTGEYLAHVRCSTSFDDDGKDERRDNCLKFGWRVYQRDRVIYRVKCVDDCRTNGWNIHVRGQARREARCKRGGCFEEGWTLFQR